MEKFWKHFRGRVKRLFDNVRKGSIADIAVLISGVALVGALVVVFVVQSLPEKPGADKNGGAASLTGASSSVSVSAQSPTQSGSAVSPFSGSSTASGSGSSSSKKPASSSSKSTSGKPASSSASASSQAPVSQSSAAPTTPEQPAQSTPPHTVHTFGPWQRVAAGCVETTEERTCTVCGYKESRVATINQEHKWTLESTITDENGNVIVTVYTCSACGAHLEQDAGKNNSTSASTSASEG